MDPRDKQEILDAINANNDMSFKAYQALFENSVKGFSEQLGQFEERNESHHKEMIEHQKVTNGRVTTLEKETSVFRWVSRNPRLAVVFIFLLVSGAIALGVVFGSDILIKMVP